MVRIDMIRALLLALPLLLLAPRAEAQDTSAVRRTPQGILLDFQDAELRTVITALAEAGGLNVSYGDLPAKRVTLRLRTPVPRENVGAVLRGLAQANGLSVSDEGGVLRIGTGSVNATDTSVRDSRLYVMRLKHARAARMAATLQAIFGGASAGPTAPARGLSTIPLSERIRGAAMPSYSVDSARRNAEVTTLPSTLVAQLKGELQIVPDEATNALLIRAVPADYETIRQAVELMDLRPQQALIEVVIAELRTSEGIDIGTSGTVTATNRANPPNTRSGELQSTSASDFILKLTQTNAKFSADIALSALATRGDVRVLSRPIILAQNNAEARILVGEQRPFVQVSRSLPTDAAVRDQVIQYRDVATTLTILPTINPDGYVNLQVLQEVSAATTETQFGAPIISTREASTHLFVRDGQTAVLGGLVGRQTDKSRSGIPILSAIPWLGALFGSQKTTTSTTELFLFLTPHVISSDDDAQQMLNGLQRAGTDTTGLKAGEKPVIIKPTGRP